MEIMISRILRYLNGCLDDDHMYRIGNFIVKHYTQMQNYDLDTFLAEGHFRKSEFYDFVEHLGYDSFENFQERLLADHALRLSQIHARMLNIDETSFLRHLDVTCTSEALLSLIDQICDMIFHKQRVVVVGALYPRSVSVDFQTDMITLGKGVVEYHQFDQNFRFGEDDLVVFITATGRTMESYVEELVDQGICAADILLITQNDKYREYKNLCADEVIHVLGKFDSLQFNYQTMMILDLIRVRYYQNY